MRTIGLLGGMSWHSTATYYRLIQEETALRRGGLASAPLVLDSLDFADIRALQLAGDWAAAGAALAHEAVRLQDAGAELLLIASNLMHKVAGDVEAATDVRVLHIADAVADAAARQTGMPAPTRLGLIGTRATMEEPFYRDRLARRGIDVVVPPVHLREAMDPIIFDQLMLGQVRRSARELLVEATVFLAAEGAQAVVLACTELGLAIEQRHTPVRLIDSVEAHAVAAVDAALMPAAVA
jgi:aspartate racemase